MVTFRDSLVKSRIAQGVAKEIKKATEEDHLRNIAKLKQCFELDSGEVSQPNAENSTPVTSGNAGNAKSIEALARILRL